MKKQVNNKKFPKIIRVLGHLMLRVPQKVLCCVVGRALSLLTLLLLFVSILMVCTALISWLPGFVTGLLQVRSSVDNLFKEIGVRSEEFLRTMLEENRKAALMIKREYEQGNLDIYSPTGVEYIRKRLFAQSRAYKGSASFVSLAFTGLNFEKGNEIYLGVARELLPGKFNEQNDEDVMTQWVTKYNQTSLNYYEMDRYSGAIVRHLSNKTTNNYFIKTRSWYQESMQGDVIGENGIWGTPYVTSVLNSLTTFISFPICNLTYTQSRNQYECDDKSAAIGCVKSNLNLGQLSSYLSTMTMPFSGFALALESNGNYLASSTAISVSSTERTSVEKIKENGIGNVMKAVRGYSDAKDPNKPFKFTKAQTFSVNGYALSVFPFNYAQLDLTFVLFFNEFTIYAFTYIYTLVTLAFLFAVLFCGSVLTCGFSLCLFWPFIRIQKAFNRIAALDLEFKKMWSPITEINNIYRSLEKMRLWLMEYKSFLPQHLLEQAEENKKKKKRTVTTTKKGNGSKVQPYDGNQSTTQGSVTSKHRGPKGTSDVETKSKPGSTTASEKKADAAKANFQVGFNGQFVSCLIFKVKNYAEMPLDLSNMEEIQKDVSEFYSLLDMLATQSKGHLASYSPSTQVIYWNVSLGKEDHYHLEKALKTAIRAIEQVKTKEMGLKFTMIIGQGFSYFGNIKVGMHRKVFEVISPFVSNIKTLSKIANELNLYAVYPECVHQELKGTSFLTRPVCKKVLKGSDREQTIYQVIGINEVKEDEWFYELKNKEENAKWERFENAFNLIYSKDLVKIREGRDLLQEMHSNFLNDEPFERLLAFANTLLINAGDVGNTEIDIGEAEEEDVVNNYDHHEPEPAAHEDDEN